MIQPAELKLNLPVELSNGVMTTTADVWNVMVASKKGDLATLKRLVDQCPELIYAQYNYTPPIHFAVREGHLNMVRYLLENGAYDPDYKTYPFLDKLPVMATDRNYSEIATLLETYVADPSLHKFKGDNGKIGFQRTKLENEFEKAVDKGDIKKTKEILNQHPEFAQDNTYFWGEGILTFAAKENDRAMIDLLISYGATVPEILKWTQFYYFEHDDGSAYILKKGMNPNTMSWQQVTILHDMAQKGNILKAGLLLKYDAAIDPVDEEYQSTPLGLAARWGQVEMVNFLLKQGADPAKAGASWSTPLAWANKKGHTAIVDILLKAGAVV